MLRLKKVISSQTRIPFSTMSAMSFFSSSHATKDFLNSSGPKKSTIYQGQTELFTTFLPTIGAKADEVEIPLQIVEQPFLQHHLLLPTRCIHLGLQTYFNKNIGENFNQVLFPTAAPAFPSRICRDVGRSDPPGRPSYL